MSGIRFEKPLRVFLSYAHDDDRETELVKKFRQHLVSSLAGEVTLWYDRQIRPGSQWEQTIAEELNTAHIFIALTSAAFGSSSYIAGKELARALERHGEGNCLLIPVRLREWTVPAHLKGFQFLPSETAVEHGEVEKKLAAVIRAIQDEIGKLAPAPPRPVPTRTVSEVPRGLAYLCDWTDPMSQLQKFAPQKGRGPCVLVTLAADEDSPEDFLDRICAGPLARHMKLDEKIQPMVRQIDWPEHRGADFAYRVNEALECEPKRLPEGQLAVVCTTINGDRWSGEDAALLDEYLAYWSSVPLRSGRGIVAVVKILHRTRTSKRQDLLAELRPPEELRLATVDLPAVRDGDAVNWARHKNVVPHYRAEYAGDLANDIRGFYDPQTFDPLPMRKLAPKLLEALRQYR